MEGLGLADRGAAKLLHRGAALYHHRRRRLSPSPAGESNGELFLRWFEWGTFCPIYRVHGVGRPFPWEYGPEGEAVIQKFDLLRYRLMPYIYTEGARITQAKRDDHAPSGDGLPGRPQGARHLG